MLDINLCFPIPKSAPTMEKVKKSKSKKVMKIMDMHFFVAETKDLTTIYSIELGIQLLATSPRSHALNMLMKHIIEVKDLVDAKTKGYGS